MYAFQISPEDVIVASDELGYAVNYDLAEYFLNAIDQGDIQKSALYGADIEEQSEIAIQSIKEELLKNIEYLSLLNMNKEVAVEIVNSIKDSDDIYVKELLKRAKRCL